MAMFFRLLNEQKRAGLDGYSPGEIGKGTARQGKIVNQVKVYAMALI
jgi:hypothetical protein